MLFRFSLYGFLKNQQYYAPFLVLAFLDKGLSFFQIGILFGFKALCLNIFEVPSGAVADLYGRRRCMLLSFSVFILAFILFAFSDSFWLILAAMFFLALGDSFRTGTHKAMIFHWLEKQGRLNQKTRVYGYTRSWSKLGSAVAAWISVGLVWYSNNYDNIFWFSAIPYALGIINFLGYPDFLDQKPVKNISLRQMFRHLWFTLKEAYSVRPLKRALAESMCFEGIYKTVADYLQPAAKQAVLVLPVLIYLPQERRTALMVGTLYFILNILSSLTSRMAYRLEASFGGEKTATTFLWKTNFTIFMLLTALFIFKQYTAASFCFLALAVLQNLWRPLAISRINSYSNPENNATLLSIESQAKSLFMVVFAPLLGLALDTYGLWPVGAMGLIICSLILLLRKKG